MKVREILLAGVVLLGAVVPAQSRDDLGVTIGANYLSRYIWRGFDVYSDDGPAIQPYADIDLYGTGFGVQVFSSLSQTGGYENSEELDIGIYYYNSVYDGERYATDYRVGWMHYGYPDEPRTAKNMQEMFAEFSWPEICPFGTVPSYTIIRAWPSEGDSSIQGYGGWLHIFGIGYDLTVPDLISTGTDRILNLSADMVYNNGYAPGPAAGGASVDSNVSHFLFGAAMDIDITENLIYTPGVYYQVSLEDTVNNEDETWFSLNLRYEF